MEQGRFRPCTDYSFPRARWRVRGTESKRWRRSAGVPPASFFDALSRELKASSRVAIDVRIGEGRHTAKVWGCDLSRRYVDINAEYMT